MGIIDLTAWLFGISGLDSGFRRRDDFKGSFPLVISESAFVKHKGQMKI
jgi:hypothetical protein